MDSTNHLDSNVFVPGSVRIVQKSQQPICTKTLPHDTQGEVVFYRDHYYSIPAGAKQTHIGFKTHDDFPHPLPFLSMIEREMVHGAVLVIV